MARAPGLGERKCPKCKEAIKADAEVCKHCGATFSSDEIAAATKVAKRQRRRLGCGCLGLIILIVGIVIALASAPDEAIPDAVADADRNIVEVNVNPMTKHSSVKVELGDSWSAKDIPVKAGMVIEKVGEVLKAGASDIPEEIETMNIWFTVPTRDLYGKDGRNKALEMRFKTADLRRVEYGKISPQGFLEFPIYVDFGGPVGRSIAEEYCAENMSDNPRFCARLAR